MSFIVPALNEGAYIVALLESITRFTPDFVPHEVIVVDNGSSDETVVLAKDNGARVLERPGASLGSVRNEGAAAAVGKVLVFLDADVRLRRGWKERISDTLERLTDDPGLISGSACLPAEDAGWVARAWADHSARGSERSHLGTGHLIVDRSEFLRIGGFDPDLATGEDFEFCRRAERQGLRLEPDPALEVEHVRYPASLGEFVRRERWHGRGDGTGIQALRSSAVVRVAFTFVALHLGLVLAVWTGAPWGGWPVAVMLSGGILLVCGFGAYRRGGFGDTVLFVQRTWLVYWYLWSRFVTAFIPDR